MKTFIVEDDKLLSLMLSLMIQKMGHVLSGSADSGKQAIKEIPRLNPDLILMDIFLADDIDGITVVETINKNNRYPVIYITGNTDRSMKDRAAETGYVAYLNKPVNYDDLLKAISGINATG